MQQMLLRYTYRVSLDSRKGTCVGAPPLPQSAEMQRPRVKRLELMLASSRACCVAMSCRVSHFSEPEVYKHMNWRCSLSHSVSQSVSQSDSHLEVATPLLRTTAPYARTRQVDEVKLGAEDAAGRQRVPVLLAEDGHALVIGRQLLLEHQLEDGMGAAAGLVYVRLADGAVLLACDMMVDPR